MLLLICVVLGHVTMSILFSDSRMTLNIPMLIMELYRLIPYKEGRYIDFHPFNMPYIKVHKIELVGIVTCVKQNVSNLFLTSKERSLFPLFFPQLLTPSLFFLSNVEKRKRKMNCATSLIEKNRLKVWATSLTISKKTWTLGFSYSWGWDRSGTG